MVIQRLLELGWDACVFGGTLRDIALRGPYTRTRDIDIVIQGIDIDEIERAMGHWVRRRNTFGGLQLSVAGSLFDIWPLHETWALKHWGIPEASSLFASFEVLPATTYLSVESIAVLLRPDQHEGRTVFERGFFESIESRVVELNRAENPYPALCVARAITTAARLGFRLGPRLTRHVLDLLKSLTLVEVVEAQRRHYRQALFSVSDLDFIVNQLKSYSDREPHSPVAIPSFQQLEWNWTQPEPIEQFVLENANRLFSP